MLSRVKNLPIEALKRIVEGEEGWSDTDRAEARDWVEILESDFELSGTLIYDSPAHYFLTDSGIRFNLDSTLFHKHNLKAGQRLKCKVVRNYSGRNFSRVTYGYVGAVLSVEPLLEGATE